MMLNNRLHDVTTIGRYIDQSNIICLWRHVNECRSSVCELRSSKIGSDLRQVVVDGKYFNAVSLMYTKGYVSKVGIILGTFILEYLDN